MNRIDLKRNGMPVQRHDYIFNFADEQYIKDYMTFLEQLDCDSGNKFISFTLSEWATGFTCYAFIIIDGPIGHGTYSSPFKYATKSVRLEVLFAAAQNKNIKLIMFFEMLGRLEFNQFQNVIIL